MAKYLKSHEINRKHVKSVQSEFWILHMLRLNHGARAQRRRNSERGLALQGSSEIVGSRGNGNYLGILELIGQFDPFLSQHIRTHAIRGRGHTSYLSSTICDELVAIMGKWVIGIIKDEIAMSRYFQVSGDSTPNITNTDHLTIILRYVHMVDHQPVERFLTFINISSHTGKNLAGTLLHNLLDQGINFENCCG